MFRMKFIAYRVQTIKIYHHLRKLLLVVVLCHGSGNLIIKRMMTKDIRDYVNCQSDICEVGIEERFHLSFYEVTLIRDKIYLHMMWCAISVL